MVFKPPLSHLYASLKVVFHLVLGSINPVSNKVPNTYRLTSGQQLNWFNHTSWVTAVTPTDRPKSVRNHCVCCHVAFGIFLWVSGFLSLD